jgi:two-component system, OmpR family, sensor histidine kinase QseC
MKLSIRNFLLINLLLTITITTTFAAIGNYYLDQADIKRHLDSLLSQSTLSFEALLGDNLNERNLSHIQKSLDQIPVTAQRFFEKIENTYPNYDYEDKYQFQVWNHEGKLILHSANSPTIPLSHGKIGFSDHYIDNVPWRVFSSYNSNLKINIVVAERYDIRNELAHQITKDDIIIMLITYILSGALIWIIIGRGLNTVKRVAYEVSHRAPSFLEPVELDIPTEIKPLVDELNRLFLRLQSAFDREKRFTGDAAHELRTPLAALKTQAQIALRATDDKERLAILRNLINGVDRCAYVVQQLLTLTQLTPEATQFHELADVNLPALTEEVIAQLVPSALDKKIDISLNSKPDDIILTGNSTALSILIRNLVDNAIRYTPEGGEIQVSLDETSSAVILRVIDNGPGIPPEFRSRVFERFFRILGNKAPGSGLGLAIVQQIAKLHHAEVNLGTPENGFGLEVEVKFPKTFSSDGR